MKPEKLLISLIYCICILKKSNQLLVKTDNLARIPKLVKQMKKSEIENQLLFSLGIFVTTCGSEGGSDSSFANTSAEYCMYCQALDREVLGLVLRSGDYERISQFFRVRHDEPETKLTNFDGKNNQ